MTKKEFYFPSADGKTTIHAVQWTPQGQPIAILQVAHGVTEYILRYEPFASYLTEKGFAVVGNDHLGHGDSVADGAQRMYFGPEGSWDYAVRDLRTCRAETRKQFPDLPCGMLGFSLGSFLARTDFICCPGEVDAAVLIGTGQTPAAALAIAWWLAEREARKTGEEFTSPLIKKLTFGTYNKKFAPNRTEFDWLCADRSSLDEYISDPSRGGDFSAGLFRELLGGMAFTAKIEQIQKMKKTMPLLLLSGDMDPVGDFGKGVRRAENRFKKAGLTDISAHLYHGMRHDLLHEACRQEIYEELYGWLKSRLVTE